MNTELPRKVEVFCYVEQQTSSYQKTTQGFQNLLLPEDDVSDTVSAFKGDKCGEVVQSTSLARLNNLCQLYIVFKNILKHLAE